MIDPDMKLNRAYMIGHIISDNWEDFSKDNCPPLVGRKANQHVCGNKDCGAACWARYIKYKLGEPL